MSTKSNLLRVAGYPTPGSGGVALHSLSISLNNGSRGKRGAHRNKGDTGRWSEAALRSLFVDVLLLQMDKKHYDIGTVAQGTADALQHLATVERPHFRWHAAKARATVVRDASGARWRKYLPTRSDAKGTIVLSGVPKGTLPAAPRFLELWLRALDLERAGKVRIKHEKPPTYTTLHRAYYRYLGTLAADECSEGAHVAASLAARRAMLHKERSGESFYMEALSKVTQTLAAFRARQRKSK